MCNPSLLFGTAGAAGTTVAAPMAFAGPAFMGGFTTAGTAATSGLFGSAGAFSLGQTFSTLSNFGNVFGGLFGGQQQAYNYEQQRAIYEYNAQIAQNNAIAAQQQALYQADLTEERFKAIRASQDPAFAKSGVLINQDTPLALSVDTTVAGALERNAILHGGRTAANAALSEAKALRFRAATARTNARGAIAGSYINAGASLLSGANMHYQKYGSPF